MKHPQQQAVVSRETVGPRRENLTLGCGCVIERAFRPGAVRRAVCPTHDERVEV